jgi:glutaminase
VAIVDGHVYEVGDSRSTFTIQSVSKAFMYGLALEDHGPDVLLKRVGVEPTGDPFNAIVLDEEANRPPNPMVNAGAIAVTGLIEGGHADERWDRILGTLSRFAGRPLSVDDAVAASETATGHRNRAIAHLMRGFDMLRPEVDEVLDLYFRQCAVRVNAVDLALMGATLAAGGTQPLTGEQVLSPEHTSLVLSVMSSCGMYDWSGEWIYRVGLPAKSGVGGGIVAICRVRRASACSRPPRRERSSVRRLRVCEELSRSSACTCSVTAARASPARRTDATPRDRAVRPRRTSGARSAAPRSWWWSPGHARLGSLERLCRHVIDRLDTARDLLLDFRRVSAATWLPPDCWRISSASVSPMTPPSPLLDSAGSAPRS